MTNVLQQAIETAYRVFARYDARGRLEVCRCNVCVTPDDEIYLTEMALRDMPASVLAPYTHSSHGMSDQVAGEFRHFLPRYFELIAADDPPSTIGPETCLDRLYDADYRRAWPAREVAAIDGFFLALVRAQAACPLPIDPSGLPERDGPLEDTLCMIARAGGELAPVLAALDMMDDRHVARHLSAMLATIDWRKRRLKNGHWDSFNRPDLDPAMRQVLAWLLRPQTRERLEAACLAESDEGAAALLSHAEGIVATQLAP